MTKYHFQFLTWQRNWLCCHVFLSILISSFYSFSDIKLNQYIMFKTRWINGKYVGQDGSVIIAVTTQKQCAQEILIIRSRDHEAQDQFVIHNIAVDTRFGSVHKTQGQSVGLHGENNFVEKRVKEMIVFDLDENFRKLDIQIQVLEYR